MKLAFIPYISTLDELVASIKTAISSPKTANLNLTTFLTILKSLAFMYRSDVVIPLALEFPPMFIALVYLAITDRSMKRSYIFTAVTQSMTRDKKLYEDFLPNIKKLIEV